MSVEWCYSVDWSEMVDGHREHFGDHYWYGNVAEARASWRNALRYGWVEPHQEKAQVSDLYKLEYEVKDNGRGPLRKRSVQESAPLRNAA